MRKLPPDRTYRLITDELIMMGKQQYCESNFRESMDISNLILRFLEGFETNLDHLLYSIKNILNVQLNPQDRNLPIEEIRMLKMFLEQLPACRTISVNVPRTSHDDSSESADSSPVHVSSIESYVGCPQFASDRQRTSHDDVISSSESAGSSPASSIESYEGCPQFSSSELQFSSPISPMCVHVDQSIPSSADFGDNNVLQHLHGRGGEGCSHDYEIDSEFIGSQ